MGTILIYGAIGFEVNSKEVVKEILAEKESIELHINSPGGNVYEGLAIFNALQRKKDILTTYVDGLAYSAASWLALVANPEKRFMSSKAQFGIHQASNFAGGNKEDLEKQKEVLTKIDEIQIQIYTESTNLSRARIEEIMKKDTPLSFKEAQEFGFQEYEAQKVAALFNITNNMDVLAKLESFLNHSKESEKSEEIEAKAKEEVTKAHKEAETPIEALSADFVKKQDFLEVKNIVENALTAFIDYVKDQPKKEEIFAKIKEMNNASMTAILTAVKTEETVPTAEEAGFKAAENVPESFEPLTLGKADFNSLFKKDK